MTAPYAPYGPGGIPVLPTIGNDVAMLGQAIQGLVAPNYQFQEQLKRALAVNPEIIAQLTNMEANSPGMLQQLLGPGQQTDALTQAQQQPGGKADDAASKYKLSILDAKKKIFDHYSKNNPDKVEELMRSGFFAELTGQNEAQTNETVAETGRKVATTGAIQQEVNIKKPLETQAGLTGKMQAISAEVRKKYPTMGSIVDAVRSGSLGSEEIAALVSDETNGPMVKYALDQMKQEFEAKMRAADRGVDWARLSQQGDDLAKQAMSVSRAELAAQVPLMQQLLDRKRGVRKLKDEQLAAIAGQLNEIEAKAHGYMAPFKDKIGTLPKTEYIIEQVDKGFWPGKKSALRIVRDGKTDYAASDEGLQAYDQKREKRDKDAGAAVGAVMSGRSSSTSASATGVTAEDANKRARDLIKAAQADRAR